MKKPLLLSLLRQARPALAATAPTLTTGTPYAVRTVARQGDFELHLVRWAEDSWTAPHDHGGGEGVVLYLPSDGSSLLENRYRKSPDGLAVVSQHIYRAPTLVRIGRDDIHAVTCEGDVISLHLYWGRGKWFRAWDEERRRTLTLQETGARIPDSDDAREIVSIAAW